MSISVYLYSIRLRDPEYIEFKIEIVATFASFVIILGVINLVLVWSQMMCLCVCHENTKFSCEPRDSVDQSVSQRRYDRNSSEIMGLKEKSNGAL